MYSRKNLEPAWKKVKQNRGSAGIDAAAISKVEERKHYYLELLQRKLGDGSYRPKPVKRVEIPKPDGGIKKLGIPTLKGFHHHLCRIWLKALRRRSQKGRKLTWEKFERIYPDWLPQPRYKHPRPNQRFGRLHPNQEPYAVVPHVRVCTGGVP